MMCKILFLLICFIFGSQGVNITSWEQQSYNFSYLSSGHSCTYNYETDLAYCSFFTTNGKTGELVQFDGSSFTIIYQKLNQNTIFFFLFLFF